MSVTDVIGDMLTRVRNGQRAAKKFVLVPHSREKESIANVLKTEGYVNEVEVVTDPLTSHPQIKIHLKYYEGRPVIQEIQRRSKPGRRVFSSIRELPLVRNGLGIHVLSTSRGIMSDVEARKLSIGGEVICYVF